MNSVYEINSFHGAWECLVLVKDHKPSVGITCNRKMAALYWDRHDFMPLIGLRGLLKWSESRQRFFSTFPGS